MTPRRSVRRKLLAVILAATAAALLVAIGAMVAYDLYLYRQSWINDLRTQADLLGRTSTAALTFGQSASALNGSLPSLLIQMTSMRSWIVPRWLISAVEATVASPWQPAAVQEAQLRSVGP